MLKKVFVLGGITFATVLMAQQLTITPLTGVEWREAVDKIGYMQIRQDSLFLMDKQGLSIGRTALADIHKMELTASPTNLQEVVQAAVQNGSRTCVYTIQGVPVATKWDVLPTGVYLMQQGTQIYKIVKP